MDMYAPQYIPDGRNEEEQCFDNCTTNKGPALLTRELVRTLGYITVTIREG